MNKARLWKSTICMTSALVLIMSISAFSVSAAAATDDVAVAATLDGATNSLAGISLSLENYYTAALNGTDANAEENDAKEAAQVEDDKKASKYANTGIAVVESFVNVRAKASTDSDVVGKLYKGGAVKVVKTEGEWINIESGSVKGYINKQYLAVGEEAEKAAGKYAKVSAVIKTETLRLREKPSTDSKTLTLLSQEEKYAVKSHDDKWVKVQIDDDLTGYVAREFVDVQEKFGKAVSIKEEQEAAAKKAAQEAAIKAQEEAIKAQQNAAANKKPSATNKKSNTTSNKKKSPSKQSSTNSVSTSKSGSAVASYGLNFVGNSYRWGGTSLTNGTDCSGFTMSVYRHFGISLPRTASAQAGTGKSVSLSQLQAGDLLFYGSGSGISHVGMYIGGGKIVHASNRRDGIKVSSYKYKTPVCARRML